MARCVPFVAIETQNSIKERKQNESRNQAIANGVIDAHAGNRRRRGKKIPKSEVSFPDSQPLGQWRENLSEVRPFTRGRQINSPTNPISFWPR